MIEAEKQCTKPGCEKLIKSRGLCDTHLYQATRGKNESLKKELAPYLLPSRSRGKANGPVTPADMDNAADRLVRGGANPRTRQAPPASKRAEEAKKARATQARQVKGRRRAAKQEVRDVLTDARISTATELAAWLGLTRLPALGGFLLVDEQNDRRVLVDKNGELREVTLTLGSVLRGGAVEQDGLDT